MKINPIQFNLIQSKPQNRVSCPLRMNNSLETDVVSFTRRRQIPEETPEEKMEKLVPQNGGFIYKKVRNKKGEIKEKVPVKVDITKKESGEFDFVHNGKIVGYTRLRYIPASECSEKFFGGLDKNYKELGIEGDRIEVKFVANENEENYGGIGHLADLLEVDACKKLGFEPNVVSYSFSTAAPFHYMRGKRFVPYDMCCTESTINRYGLSGEDPNETVKEIIKNSKKGDDFDTTPIKQGFLLMYMPKEMSKELEEELKEHPIF